MKQDIKDTFMTIRVSRKLHADFHEKASKYGSPSDVAREMFQSFVEDRIIIKDKNRGELYVTGE